MNQVLDKKQNISVYDANANGMARKFNSIGARVKDIDKIFSYLNKDNPYILEIGCGNGRDAQEFLKRTTNYLGIDYSWGMIEIARRRSPQGTFKICDFADCNYPIKADAIVAFAALVHSPRTEVKKVFEKSYQSLSDGGIFYISLKLGDHKRFIKKDEFGPRIFYFYTSDDIKKLAGDKFKVIYEHKTDLRGQKWFEIILQK